MFSISSPFPIFTDVDGDPLKDGYVYIGTAGVNAETNPIQVYWDPALTIPAAQPIRTINGYPSRSGSPGRIYINADDCSTTIRNKNGSLVYSVVNSTERIASSQIDSITSNKVTHTSLLSGATQRTALSKFDDFVDVKDFGAAGDGVTDDSAAIQAALNAVSGRTLYFPKGVYILGSQIIIKTKTRLIGDGRNKSTIKLANSFASNTAAIRNDMQAGALNTYYDESISIEGITFDGSNNATRTAALLSLTKILDVDIHHCGFINHTYITVELGANKAVQVTNNYFEGNGRPMPSTVSAPCIWTDTVGGDIPYDVIIENNYFIGNFWSCAYFMPQRGSFSFNHCMGNGESGVFSNTNGYQLRYIGNHIEGQQRSNISASGIETGAHHVTIADNVITGNDSDGISLTDVQNAVVHDNIIFNNGQDPGYFTTAAGIAIITTAASPTQPDHINIHDNRIGDRQGTKTQVSGIVVGGTGSPVERVVITNNNLAEQKTNSLSIDATKWGANSFVANNIDKNGAVDRPFKIVRFQVAASTGNQSISGVGFRPRAIEIHAILSSGTQAYSSTGVHDGVSTECNYSAVDRAGQAGSPLGSPSIIQIVDSTFTVLADSDVVSLDADGFTINNTLIIARPWCIAKCYM